MSEQAISTMASITLSSADLGQRILVSRVVTRCMSLPAILTRLDGLIPCAQRELVSAQLPLRLGRCSLGQGCLKPAPQAFPNVVKVLD